MMKKLNSMGALALALMVLCSCTPAAPSQSPTPAPVPVGLTLTRQDFPRLNGSTSTAPLARAMCAALLGEPLEQVNDLVNFSKTTASYRALMDGNADLLLSAEPADSVVAERAERNYDWEMAPIATDALVFLVNEANPVDSLTHQELLDIYTGEITNWSQVGGEDREIIPFQRNAEAGSQTLMKKLVMGDTPLMEPAKDYIIAGMEGLIEAVRAYDGSPGAIGYTVYYYANDMNMADGLKVVAVEGNKPDADTIRSGAYPFTNPYYAVISASALEHSTTRQVFEWLQGPVGQSLIAHEGYVSIQEEVAQVDWAMGEQVPLEEVYTRLSSEPMPELVLAEDYGPLLPYVGGKMSGDWWDYDRYGLVTLDGTIVTDSVYSGVWQLFNTGAERGNLPIYVLETVVTGKDGEEPERRCAMAALDGSWITGFDYRSIQAIAPDRIWAVEGNGDGVMFNALLEEQWRLPLPTGEEPWVFQGGMEGNTWWSDGVGIVQGKGILTPDGRLISNEGQTWENLQGFQEGLSVAMGQGSELWGYVNLAGDWVIPPQYVRCNNFQAGAAIVDTPEGIRQVLDTTGTVLLETEHRIVYHREGEKDYYMVCANSEAGRENEVLGVYDREGQPVDSPMTGKTLRWYSEEWWSWEGEGETVLYSATKSIPLGEQGVLQGKYDWGYLLRQTKGGKEVWLTLDKEGSTLLSSDTCDYIWMTVDEWTGEKYLCVQEKETYRLYTIKGEFLMELPNWPSITDGLVQVRTDLSFGYRTLDGDWAFRLSLMKSGED